MNPEVIADAMNRRKLTLWAFVLLIVASAAFWLVQARAADDRDKPYKYVLVEEVPGTKILHGIRDPVIDAVDVYIEKDGKREPISLDSLAIYVNKKYASDDVDTKINHFVRLFNPYESRVIEKVADIPGYAPDQLDPDIDPADVKTWSFTFRDARPGRPRSSEVIVKYVWEWMGHLQRFRFVVDKKTGQIRCDRATVLQDYVGGFGGLD